MMKHRWKGAAGLALLAAILILPAIAAPRGSRGGFGFGRSREITGAVSAVNSTANTLSVQANVRALTVPITLLVPPTVPITRISTTGLAGLKVGDTVEVSGLPVAIQAAAIRASSLASPPSGTTSSGTTSTTGGATSPGPTTAGSGTTTGAAVTPRPRAAAQAVGTVQSVDPTKNQVVAKLADGTLVTVTAPADLLVTREDQVILAGAQVGDRVRAEVTIDSAGNYTAVALELIAVPPAPMGGTTTGSAPVGTSTAGGA